MKSQLSQAQNALEANIKTRGNTFYPQFHLSPPAGWMNDPNGLIYHNGLYHAFYQHHPFDANWGPMHWGHATSEDMVHWTAQPIALAPRNEWDRDGCFSGSAVDDNGVLSLIYTGHIWLDGSGNDSAIRQVQCLATSQDGIHFEKQGVILNPPPGIMHFRDPKVWQQDGEWWMVIGARDLDDQGLVLLYRGSSLRDWQLDRILAQSDPQMGYMWECPDFFPLGDNHLLMFSPQGIKAQGFENLNLFQSGYLRGKWQPGSDFSIQEAFVEMDRGHDFYAPQSFIAADGRRVVMGWMDMWESPMPGKQEGWAGSLTLPRELSLGIRGEVLQNPVAELETLRSIQYTVTPCWLDIKPQQLHQQAKTIELELCWNCAASSAQRYGLRLGSCLELYVDSAEKRLVLSRHSADEALNSERSVAIDTASELKLRVFIDHSSVEVFINQGEACMTSRIYPQPDDRQLTLFADQGRALCHGGLLWELSASQ